MSRYFKFKSPEDLTVEADRLGVSDDVRLVGDLAPLLRPTTVAGRRVGNRLAIQPMEGCDGTADGSPDELTIRRYRRFGAGGAKLIWGEAAAVESEARANPRQLVADESHRDGLARLLDACRQAHREAIGDDSDLLVGLQLTHSGRYSYSRPLIAQHDPLLDPRTLIDRPKGIAVTAEYPLLSDDDLDRLQDRYVEAAGVARRAGFDFIDLKQCHRSLLNELLAGRTRPGKYGGPFENRSRFIREVVGRIRAEEPGLIVATRLNVFDGLPYRKGPDGLGIPEPFEPPVASCWGTDPEDPSRPDLAEPLALIGMLKDLGVSMVNVTLGNPYASPHLLRPFEYPPPDGYETPEHPLLGVARHLRLTAAVQRAYPDLPVVGSGYSWLQAWMLPAGASSVAEGRATFMGVGRGSLSHPDFASHAEAGEPLDPKRTCRTFSYCTALMRSKHHPTGQYPTGCPPFDKAAYGPIWKEAQATDPTLG